MSMSSIRFAAAISVGLATIQHAGAAVTMTITHVGSDVVFAGSGSLDLTGLTSTVNTFWSSPAGGPGAVEVGGGAVRMYLGLSGPSLGENTTFQTPVQTGDAFGITTFNMRFYVPLNYVSGSPLAGTATFTNTTVAGMGFTPGTYTFTLPGTGDTVTVMIPAPGAAALLGSAGLFATRRQRRR